MRVPLPEDAWGEYNGLDSWLAESHRRAAKQYIDAADSANDAARALVYASIAHTHATLALAAVTEENKPERPI